MAALLSSMYGNFHTAWQLQMFKYPGGYFMPYRVRQLLAGLLLLLSGTVMGETPALELERLDGGMQGMADFIGQGEWVVVNVWSPSCRACVIEIPKIRQFRREHPHIPFLGVTIDFPSFEYGKPEVIRTFLKTHPLDYPLFLADMNLASELIGKRLVAIPLIAIFHPDGRAVARWPGKIKPEEIMEFINNYDSYSVEDDNLMEGL